MLVKALTMYHLSYVQFHKTSAPAFCYVMKEAVSEEGMIIIPTEKDSSVVKERITRLTHLGQVRVFLILQ